MQVTVSEALRLKKEISASIAKAEGWLGCGKSKRSWAFDSDSNSISFGRKFEDDAPLPEEGKIASKDLERKLISLLKLSQDLNSTLSKINVETGISDLVRQRQNKLLLIRMYEEIIKNSKASKGSKFEVVGDKRVCLSLEFRPYIDTAEATTKSSTNKEEVRTTQQKIDILNATLIEVPFSYSELEDALF
jgi:hypothetical protein